MKIVSGKMGTPHVSSHEFRQIIDGIIGHGSYILNGDNNLEPELVSNNLLKIKSGMLAHHGNVSSVKNYDEIELANGTQGVKRIDLIVSRYTRDDETKIEDSSWVLIQGTPHASSPVVPSYEVGDLQEGDLIDDCPFLEVHYDGINVTEVKKLVPVVQSNSELKYNPGDTEECVFWGGSMLTGSNKNVYFTITTTKDMSEISDISVTSPEINIRQGGNYLAGSASSNSSSGFSVSCQKLNSKTLRILVEFASSIGGTNNDAAGLMFKGTLNFA